MKTRILVDTGSVRSCISQNFLRQLKLKYQPLRKGDLASLFAANGSHIKILGKIELTIKIEGLHIPFQFLVLENLHHKIILGTDFLTNAHAVINMQERTVIFADLVEIPFLPTKQENILTTCKAIMIPPQTEALISVDIPFKYRLQESIVEPLNSNNQFLIGKLLVKPTQHQTICRVLNCDDTALFIKKGRPLATISPATLAVTSLQTEQVNTAGDKQVSYQEKL